MSINLGPNVLNTSLLKPLNFSHYFTVRGKTGYTVWLNDSYHTLLSFANKFCQAFTNKAKICLVYCLYEAYGTYWGKITAEQQNERQMYRKLCQKKNYVKPVSGFFSKGATNKREKKICLYLRKSLKSLSCEMGTFIKHYLDVRNLPFF